MLAMPIAMPSAESAARSRRVRSPDGADAQEVGRQQPCASPVIASTSMRPSRSATRRGSAAASSRSWVMTTIVVPSALSSRSRSMISAPERESRLPVGSSAKTIAGRATSARAIATRWRSPPESCSGRWARRCSEAHALERRARRRGPPLGAASPL